MKKIALTLLIFALAFSTLLIPNQRAHAALCKSNGSGFWTNPATWTDCGGNYPGQFTNDYVQIQNGHTVTVNAAIGAIYYLEIQNGGAVIMNPTTSLKFSASGGTPGMSVTGSGSFTMASDATIYFADDIGTAAHTVSGNFSFSRVVIDNVGVDFGSNSTITNFLAINWGGYVFTNAPTYADNSSLTYDTGSNYTVGSEWFANVSSGQGVPYNVLVTNSTTLDFGAADRTLRGSLTLTNGSTLNGAASHTLTVQGSVILNNGATLNAPNLLQVGGNWDNTATFNHQNKTVQFNGSAAQTIVDTHNSTTFYNMEVLNGSTVSIPNPVLPTGTEINVSNQLTNNGTLQQTLSVPGNATTTFLNITNGSGTDKYFGVQITTPDDTGMGNTTVKIHGNSACTNDDTSGHVHRCFDITPTTSTAADVTFYYLNSEINGNTAGNVSVWHWKTGVGWQKETGTYTYNSSGDYQSVKVTNVDEYSPFVLDDVNPGLPTAITLSEFAAQHSSAPVWIFAGIAAFALILGGAALRKKLPSPPTPLQTKTGR